MIRTNTIAMTSGKGVKPSPTSTGIVNPSSIRLTFTTGSIITNYYSGATIIGTGDTLANPFFGESGYTLDGFYRSDGTSLTSTSTLATPMAVIFENGNISFTGSTPVNTSVVVGMSVGYHGSKKILELDRRFGRVTVK
ncbi:MAG: hypothetical protein Q8K26_00110 [Candidatus Gracilibacteria bacterium]|nr:hypothetical protein [Candidatus Gracilibacteria bacterium]